MNKEQLERKAAKANYKLSLLNDAKHQEERNALITQILKSEIPNWDLKIKLN